MKTASKRRAHGSPTTPVAAAQAKKPKKAKGAGSKLHLQYRCAPVQDAVEAGLAQVIASLPCKISKVPSCTVTRDGIPGSLVYPVLQSQWELHTSEILVLCHEAVER